MGSKAELLGLMSQLGVPAYFMSNTHNIRKHPLTRDLYLKLMDWDPKESVRALIEDMLEEDPRIGGMMSITLLNDITGIDPAHFTYTDKGYGFVAVTVSEAREAWRRWWEEKGQYEYDEDAEIPL